MILRPRLLPLPLFVLLVHAQGPSLASASSVPASGGNRPAVDVVVLDAQIELQRRGFSCGSIDGVMGSQTAAALRAFQRTAGLTESSAPDAETRAHLALSADALTTHTLREEEIAALRPLPLTWLGKSEERALVYATALEFIAERYRANPGLIRRLNPTINWDAIQPGALIKVPAVERIVFSGTAANIRIGLEERKLEVFDANGRLVAYFPVSIARNVTKRPLGDLHVTVVIPAPNYTFDPEVYPESAEAKQLGRKLILPPGPNNPVGSAWIGLNLPGYGIHGTPDPEKVGRTESHGCFRLANWDALALTTLVKTGLPVVVEP